MNERIQNLRIAVEHVNHCEAAHASSTVVRESFQGQTVWEGVVESFIIRGRPTADRCYAWSYDFGGETHHTTVLQLPPVDSPETAVKMALAARATN
jgi:hypothetical protein